MDLSDNTSFLSFIFQFWRCSLRQFSCPLLQKLLNWTLPFLQYLHKHNNFSVSMDNIFKACHWILSLHFRFHQLLTLAWLVVLNVLDLTAVHLGLYFMVIPLLPWVLIQFLASTDSTSVLLTMHKSFVKVNLLFESSCDIGHEYIIIADFKGRKQKERQDSELPVFLQSNHQEILMWLSELLFAKNVNCIFNLGHN